MWPWEHAAFAYVLYSLLVHVFRRRAPTGGPVYAVALGSQFPDLVDKPLAWSVGVFESGYAVAHSAFAFPFLAAGVLFASHRRGRLRLGVAFLVGHASHLAGDVVYPAVTDGHLAPTAVLWPIVEPPTSEARAGLLAQATRYFGEWFVQVRALDPGPLLLFEGLLALSVLLLWLLDGTPGLGPLRKLVTRPNP
jgi:hypothetical protein